MALGTRQPGPCPAPALLASALQICRLELILVVFCPRRQKTKFYTENVTCMSGLSPTAPDLMSQRLRGLAGRPRTGGR